MNISEVLYHHTQMEGNTTEVRSHTVDGSGSFWRSDHVLRTEVEAHRGPILYADGSGGKIEVIYLLRTELTEKCADGNQKFVYNLTRH